MDPLPPIPTPASQRWREFRIQVMPIIVFIGAVFAVVMMWKNYVAPAGFIGEVESVRANVSIVEPGTLIELSVDLFQNVTKGQPIGLLRAFDPDSTQAQVAAIEADLKVLRARIALDEFRNVQSTIQLRLDLMEHRVRMATARANLQLSLREQERLEKLFNEKEPLVSASELDDIRREVEIARADISEREKLIPDFEQKIQELEALGSRPGQTDAIIEAAIKTQEAQLQAIEKPSTLKAPIDGVVSAIYFRPGEKVLAGLPIVTITAAGSQRIMGYARAPVTVQPEVGMQVEVRPRSTRTAGLGHVLGVGVQLESISTARFTTGLSSNIFEQALPFTVSIPADMKLLPGEVVDLSLRSTVR